MIVKHIPARPAGRNATIERARHARNLVDYLRQPEKQSAEKDYQVAYMLREGLGDTKGERLFHIGARNFVSTDCGSAWKRDPVSGVIGVEKGPLILVF